MRKKKVKETQGKSSPKGGKRGCLCKDNTYSQSVVTAHFERKA